MTEVNKKISIHLTITNKTGINVLLKINLKIIIHNVHYSTNVISHVKFYKV